MVCVEPGGRDIVLRIRFSQFSSCHSNSIVLTQKYCQFLVYGLNNVHHVNMKERSPRSLEHFLEPNEKLVNITSHCQTEDITIKRGSNSSGLCLRSSNIFICLNVFYYLITKSRDIYKLFSISFWVK